MGSANTGQALKDVAPHLGSCRRKCPCPVRPERVEVANGAERGKQR